MLEKLSVDFVRKIFAILTNGNAQIKFYTICMQNRNREKATNKPVEFGMKLLGCNILYRLPGVRNIPFGRTIGQHCLTRRYLRLPVEDLASEILENPHAICDVQGSLLLPVLSEESLYRKLEAYFSCPGFAALRKKLQDVHQPIEEIYAEISRRLKRTITCEAELHLAKANWIPNRYIIRFLDIASYHGVGVHLVLNSSYPSSFFAALLKYHGVVWNSLQVSCEAGTNKTKMACQLGLKQFSVVSADFNHCIRPMTKHGGRPIYYRAPVQLMQDALHPRLCSAFKEKYDAICGARVFSGRLRPSFLYELGYLCVGPLENALLSLCRNKFTVCYAHAHSSFARLAARYAQCTCNSAQHFDVAEIQVFHTGITPNGFSGFLEQLRKNNPDAEIQVLPLQACLAEDTALLAGLFSGADSDMIKGAQDFCRDYTRYTQGEFVPLKDAVNLYCAGKKALKQLLDTTPVSFWGRPAASV